MQMTHKIAKAECILSFFLTLDKAETPQYMTTLRHPDSYSENCVLTKTIINDGDRKKQYSKTVV
jgi:hypothetical protein